jgi:hypothetical protein
VSRRHGVSPRTARNEPLAIRRLSALVQLFHLEAGPIFADPHVCEGGATTRRMSSSSLDCAPTVQTNNNITLTTMADHTRVRECSVNAVPLLREREAYMNRA